jgi:dienelactone hydrolase
MHDTTKQKLVDELVARGYVVLLVDSYATRGIDHACTSGAADCSNKVAGWGNDGPPVELVVYPGAHHGFYYPHLQPGTILFGHRVEYNAAGADNADQRLHQFLDRHLK